MSIEKNTKSVDEKKKLIFRGNIQRNVLLHYFTLFYIQLQYVMLSNYTLNESTFIILFRII